MKRHAFVVAALTVLALACTSERATAPLSAPVQYAVTYQGLQAQLVALFPSNATSLQNAALRHLRNIERDLSGGNVAGAQSKMLSLVDFIFQKFNNGQLLDPNGSAPPTTDQAVCVVVNSLYEFVGLTGPGGCSVEDGASVIIGPEGGTVVTGTQQAGVDVPAGALTQTVLLVITRLPDPTGDPGTGPLNTNLKQYPRFYEYSIFPEIPLTADLLVGVCVYDPPNPFAPPATIAPRLRLAHNVGEGIEILDLVAAPFLVCDNTAAAPGFLNGFLKFAAGVFSPKELFAATVNPGGVGGLAGGFSPFGAVDPGPAPDGPPPPPPGGDR